jgi:esterase/lipase
VSETGLYNDAKACYKYLINHGYSAHQIIIYGRSIGTGIASYLANRVKCAGLILETPYSNICDLVQEYCPLIPRMLLKYDLDNIKHIRHLQIPILLLHGTNDTVIDCDHSKQIYKTLTSPHKYLTLIRGGAHNDLSLFDEHATALQKFINTIAK